MRASLLALLVSVAELCSCASAVVDNANAAPVAAPPNPDVGCEGAPDEALDLAPIRQRRDRCEAPRSFECERRSDRSLDVTRVRLFFLGDDEALVSTTTGRPGARNGAFARSTRRCRRVTRDRADAIAALFTNTRTVEACRSADERAAADDGSFSIGGFVTVALRSQAMFCVDRFVAREPCAVMFGEPPIAQIADVCDAMFQLADAAE